MTFNTDGFACGMRVEPKKFSFIAPLCDSYEAGAPKIGHIHGIRAIGTKHGSGEKAADKEEPLQKPSLWKRTIAGIGCLALIGGIACGGSNNAAGDASDIGNDTITDVGDVSNAVNPIPSSYNVAEQITPEDSTVVGSSDNPLEVGVTTPALNPECSADPACTDAASPGVSVDMEATYDNATPENTADDETVIVASQAGVPFDTYTSGTLDMEAAHSNAGLADGEKITIEVVVTAMDAEDVPRTARGNATLTYEAGTMNQPPVVDRCNITGSNVGSALAITCLALDPAGADLYGRWNLTTDFPGATISEEGGIWSSTGGLGDVGLHDFSVTVSDGEVTSAPYDFRIPFDEHKSYVQLHCTNGSNPRLLLPETSVDAVAVECGDGFNPALKPRPFSAADPDYILDVDVSCVQGAIAALPAEERAIHVLYNNATTVGDFYSDYTVDFAQVFYGN